MRVCLEVKDRCFVDDQDSYTPHLQLKEATQTKMVRAKMVTVRADVGVDSEHKSSSHKQ